MLLQLHFGIKICPKEFPYGRKSLKKISVLGTEEVKLLIRWYFIKTQFLNYDKCCIQLTTFYYVFIL